MLKREGLSRFEIAVLLYVYDNKDKDLITYKEIAEAIGHSRAYRAVGNALHRNPFPEVIPCYKVIRSDMHIGSYVNGRDSKRILLQRSLNGKGYKIINDRVIKIS